MAKAAPTTFRTFSSSNPNFHKSSIPPASSSFLKLPTTYSTKCRTQFLTKNSQSIRSPCFSPIKATPSSSSSSTASFHGLCYVVDDNIDTDQIIPAEYLTLVPSNPEEYQKLGSYALIGLPSSYQVRFIDENETKTKYSIIIAGANFGCGSSREHAPVALGAAGTKAIVAESYARIFFRNSVSTGEVYPLESEVRICEEFTTGDVATVELAESKLINHTTGKEYTLKSIGDAGPVIDAGGIFAYARQAGMIASAAS
ncbi:3-isopropylmalate dehydratase small subunit 1 [Beta vulgaris subsp. vulgaris]|uniref:3-isopropylmalate dehydratase small subunit 1 n=1 Tax=Beta vulgaris subsp. vulgaris TaxID=3555 RepID=UPI002036A8A8|nr:3-isopropylmalate dehydratase small subunit 1 [Beta vulgaris subsp. vulgaris]XP_010667035.2 3-isopropylmalate dehydratase small subunit 1 [Beta vulgaris subsp. vulgaris]XP_057250951.1 3-isopropylmalate dehydratase small subunit 1 [Beta vulgaris subsp. vulgaris]XP_057250952.1 3-isopropylmalate dehydratase small subunit 1 [Beta vulgaris subsp. vulgaris]